MASREAAEGRIGLSEDFPEQETRGPPPPRLLLKTSGLKSPLFFLLLLFFILAIIPTPVHRPCTPPFKLIKLGCFIRGHTHPSKALHTHSGLIKPIVHTCTHTHVHIYRTPRSSIFLSPNPSLSHPHPPTLLINSSHPFSLTLHSPPHPSPSSRETHFSREGGIERKRDGGGGQRERK